MSHVALARQWRPQKFETVVGHTFAVQALRNAIVHQKLHHAYLFTGTRGVGKTTLARLFAKALNCTAEPMKAPCGVCMACVEFQQECFPDFLEIDAASRTKVEETRALLETVAYAPQVGPYKIYLIDEVHMLSTHSFNALLKTLEEPPAHTKFLFATTEVARVPATIRSRCLSFHLQALSPEEIAGQLTQILEAENATFEPAAVMRLAVQARGSLRDALSLLEQVWMLSYPALTLAQVTAFLGDVSQESLVTLTYGFLQADCGAVLTLGEALLAQGDFAALLDQWLTFLHTLAVAQALPERSASVAIQTLASCVLPEQIQNWYHWALLTKQQLPLVTDYRQALDLWLLRSTLGLNLVQSAPTSTVETLAAPAAKPVPVVAAESVAPQPQPVVTTIVVKTGADLQWMEIVPRLSVVGLLKTIVEQLEWVSLQGQTLTLKIDPQLRNCLDDMREQKLKEALKEVLGFRPVLMWVEGEVTHTFAQQREQLQAAEAAQRKTAVMSDTGVQDVLAALEADIETVMGSEDA